MLTLRSTKRLMHYLAVRSDPGADDGSQTLLGAWYAKVVDTPVGPAILCVNEHTRYAIPIMLDPQLEDHLHWLYTQLVWRIHEAMRSRGIEQGTVSRVIAEYRGGITIAPTASRSVLGTINDMAMQFTYHVADALDGRSPIDLEAVEQKLNQTPILPMKGANPGEMLIKQCRAGAASQ